MDHFSLVDKEAMDLYSSDKAKDYRTQLDMLSAEISEHQYWLLMLTRRYQSLNKDYKKYLKIEEEQNGSTIQ